MTLKTVFDVDDLSDYLREVAGKNHKVAPLEREKWVVVGGFKIFLLDVVLGLEDSYIKVLVGRYRSVTGDAVVKDGPLEVKACHLIPETNLIFDLWIDRNQSNLAVPLVVEKGFGVTLIEDFMGIATNLPESVLEKVAKAVITKRVVWDESKANLVGEGCDGEFVFEGCRYSFDEVFESPSGLFLRQGTPDYINSLLGILEAERLNLLNNHQYSKAKDAHEKMESLRKVLQKL